MCTLTKFYERYLQTPFGEQYCKSANSLQCAGFFCALLEKLRSAKNSGFRHNSGIFSENSGIFAENPDIFLKKCKFDGI